MGLRRQGKFGAGLVEELAALLAQLGESGRVPEPLSLADAIAEDARARRGVIAAMDALRAALSQTPPSKTAQGAAEAIAAFGAVALDHAPGQLPWAQLRAASPRAAARGPLAEPLAEAKAAWETLLDADAGVRGASLSRDLAMLARQASQLHRELKTRKGVLDFDDLTRLSRDLLVQHPAVRAAERDRIGALLIDELQDTSRAQLELFEQLAPDRTVVVGDRKQSIYEFRGADVAGAHQLAGPPPAPRAERRGLSPSPPSLPAL